MSVGKDVGFDRYGFSRDPSDREASIVYRRGYVFDDDSNRAFRHLFHLLFGLIHQPTAIRLVIL
jgi:hypothetical protein